MSIKRKFILRFNIFVIAIAGFALYKINYKMPLKEYRKYALYMAVLDDEISRNELEAIANKEIKFDEKIETLSYKYDLFLEMNRKKSKEELEDEIKIMQLRLEDSKQYLKQEI